MVSMTCWPSHRRSCRRLRSSKWGSSLSALLLRITVESYATVALMSAFTYLITGASRSLGLGYTRQLLQSGKHVRVVAGARSPSSAEDLQKLRKEVGEDRLYILKLDVEDSAQVANSVKELESSGFLKDGALDCLINNAGVARAHSKNPSQV